MYNTVFGSTNDNKPFEPGEIIKFFDDRYEVLENHGTSGTVKALNDGGCQITGFKWTFCGDKCIREQK